MMQAVLAGVVSLILTITVPAVLLSPIREPEAEKVVLIRETARERDDSRRMIKLAVQDEVMELEVEDYIVGVVLAEMPASFENEALKAQAVAARTFAVSSLEHGKHESFDLCSDSSCCQAWIDREAVREKIGDALLEKGRAAVEQTADEVITYNGALIEAVYFSCSGGTTEAAAAVWGSEVPYLQSVTSSGEETANKYKSRTKIDAGEFEQKLKNENAAVVFSESSSWIGDIFYTQGGGVDRIKIGGQWFSGTQIRKLFQLNSTKFQVFTEEDAVVFEVYGYGHRVGMSQYGANAMALEGYDYRQILSHYYTGISVERLQ